jgi:hypothetical protein
LQAVEPQIAIITFASYYRHERSTEITHEVLTLAR